MENYLEIRGVKKVYGKKQVLNNVSFHVPKESIVGFIGNNGAGKSTTFKSILGMCQIDGGEIELFEESIKPEKSELKQKIGVVFDTLHLPERLTIAQVSRMFSKIYTRWNAQHFKGYLKQFSLSNDLIVGNLSRGMSMKLSLAIALSHEAKLLLLDEATSGLDPSSREEVLQILKSYVEENQASVLLSSHIIEDVESTADRIVHLKNGKIVANIEKESFEYRNRKSTLKGVGQ